MLWSLYCLPLLFKVLQRSGSCCGWLYCLPLLFKVLQKNGSICGRYIVYHYCSRFDRGVVHVVVVILSTITLYGLTKEWFMLFRLALLSTITVLGLTEEWFMLLLLCLPLLFKV